MLQIPLVSLLFLRIQSHRSQPIQFVRNHFFQLENGNTFTTTAAATVAATATATATAA
jgi:hypothetical protein